MLSQYVIRSTKYVLFPDFLSKLIRWRKVLIKFDNINFTVIAFTVPGSTPPFIIRELVVPLLKQAL